MFPCSAPSVTEKPSIQTKKKGFCVLKEIFLLQKIRLKNANV